MEQVSVKRSKSNKCGDLNKMSPIIVEAPVEAQQVNAENVNQVEMDPDGFQKAKP